MSRSMAPCKACSRHITSDETACPFCGAPQTSLPEPRGVQPLRASRAALFAAGAGTLLATAGCSQSTTPIDTDAAAPDAIAMDAPVTTDAGSADAVAPDASLADAPFDAPTAQPAYGAPVLLDGSQ